MRKITRDELRKRFEEGRRPSTSDFGMLIDSTMNISDDGIEYRPDEGLRLTQGAGDSRLLSFYAHGSKPGWSMRMAGDGSTLSFGNGNVDGNNDSVGGAVLSMGPQGRVGINQTTPGHALDVGGTVASTGRRGVEYQDAMADGEWHTIRADLAGCVALEVVAGTGRKDSGKYALMHAFATKLFDANGDISYHRSHYGARRHRLDLRWLQQRGADKFSLQIRVHCHYGDGVRIRYHITALWDDPRMEECAAVQGGGHG
jgi:hypothetical protein